MSLDRLRPIVASATVFVLLLAARPVADTPRLALKQGAVVKRTLSMKGKRDLTSLAMKAGEQEQSTTDAQMHVDLSWKQVVVDEYTSVDGNRVKQLERTYESLADGRTETSKDKGGEEKTRDLPQTSDLEGQTVVFTWDADKKEHVATFKSGDHDKKLVADLEVDMDYRALLPPEDATEGAKWEADFADVKGVLLRPGGDIPFHGEKETPPMDRRMRAAVWDATKGKVKLRLKAAREEDGVKVAVIAFEGTRDVDASAEREGEEAGPEKVHAIDAQTFEGELLWNLAQGRPHSIAWTSKGTFKVTVRLGKAKSKTGEEIEIEQTLSFDEDFEYTGSFEAK